jgi:hypothetical protein
MAKEEKPLEYQRRERTTKWLAQRLDLSYRNRPAFLRVLRRRVAWIAVAASAVAAIPMVMGVAAGKRALLTGPVSSSHQIFLDRCEVCHRKAFTTVPDAACVACHDGPAHPAKTIDTALLRTSTACADCHMEHRGSEALASVSNRNCTNCHRDLKAHASGVQLAGVNITAFAPGMHPDFLSMMQPDNRPLRLNHAIHLPSKPTVFRGMKLPMQCEDCHRIDRSSAKGDPIPITFQENCSQCHARELDFDVYEILGANSKPAPHTKDPKTIHQFIFDTYSRALAEDPSIIHRRLGNDVPPVATAPAWLERVVRDSELYLFQRKCNYCHVDPGFDSQGYPVIQPVDPVEGHYVSQTSSPEPWLRRGEFNHRAHRAVSCESCHTKARSSTKTADILIPAMKSCLPCHEGSNGELDRCSKCHLYHNKSLEKEHRRPTDQILTGSRMEVQ